MRNRAVPWSDLTPEQKSARRLALYTEARDRLEAGRPIAAKHVCAWLDVDRRTLTRYVTVGSFPAADVVHSKRKKFWSAALVRPLLFRGTAA